MNRFPAPSSFELKPCLGKFPPLRRTGAAVFALLLLALGLFSATPVYAQAPTYRYYGGWLNGPAGSQNFTMGGIGTAPDTNNWPFSENPNYLNVDFGPGKFLIFKGSNAGFVWSNTSPAIAYNRLSLTTANDAIGRDPASYIIYGSTTSLLNEDYPGTNIPVSSLTEIASGTLALTNGRNDSSLTPAAVASPAIIQFSNTTAYPSYVVVFPTTKDGPTSTATQISKATFSKGTLTVPNQVLMGKVRAGVYSGLLDSGVIGTSNPGGNWPAGEHPGLAFDGLLNTKFLIFQASNSFLLASPEAGTAVVNSLSFWTAGDAPERDPASYKIYGLEETFEDTSFTEKDPGTLIAEGPLNLPTARNDGPTTVNFTNTTAYASYVVVFPTVRNLDENSQLTPGNTITQIAEIAFAYNAPVVLPTVTLSATDASADENTGGTGILRVSRTGGTTDALTVSLRVDGASTALAADWTQSGATFGTLAPGSLGNVTIPAGSSFVDITLTPVNDSHAEANETVNLLLVADTAYTLGSPANDTITIGQNDFVVNSIAASGEGTLNQAIVNANALAGTDAITFDATAFGTAQTINVSTQALPQITSNLSITGPAARVTVRGTTSGFRILDVAASSTVHIENLSFLRAAYCVYNSGTVTVSNCSFSVVTGAAIQNTSLATVDGCTFEAPTAVWTTSIGDSRVLNSTFNGGDLDLSRFRNEGTARMTNCTFSRFSSGNSTSVRNTAGATLDVTHCTILGGADAAGEWDSINNAGTLTLKNSIAVGRITGAFNDSGGNIILNEIYADPTSIGLDPLGLQDNGGPTQTIALLSGSPAIGGGLEENIPVDLTTDQRGFPRAVGTVDSGAYEVQKPLILAATPASVLEGSGSGTTAFTFTVTRPGGTTDAVSVDYAVTGTGTSPADATDFGGTFPSGSVTLASGVSSAEITIQVSADAEVEPDETFAVTLSNPFDGNTDGGYTIGAPAIATITNDDVAAAPEIDVVSVTYVGAEEVHFPLASGADLSAGEVAIGSELYLSFRIFNSGTETLNLAAAGEVGILSGSEDFYLPRQRPNRTIAPGASVFFDVVFSPTSLGLKSTVLSFASDDADENPYTINLSGTGIPAPETVKIGDNTVLSVPDFGSNTTVTNPLTGETVITGTVDGDSPTDKLSFTLPEGKAVTHASLRFLSYAAAVPRTDDGFEGRFPQQLTYESRSQNDFYAGETEVDTDVVVITRCAWPNFSFTLNAPEVESFRIVNLGPGDFFEEIVKTYGSARYELTFTIGDAATTKELSNLTSTNSSLSPAFESGVTSYAVTVPTTQTFVELTPTWISPTIYASMQVNGGTPTRSTSGQSDVASGLVEGANTVLFRVCAQDGSETIYTVNITRGESNLAPTFSGYAFSTAKNTQAQVATAKILARAADADGGTLTISSVGAATSQGGGASVSDGLLTFTPLLNFTGMDSIAVTISDGQGGSVSGSIIVTVTDGSAASQNQAFVKVLGSGNIAVLFFGIPDQSYEIQRSTDLVEWTEVFTTNAQPDGAIPWEDTNPPPGGTAFYRTAVGEK